MVSSEVVPDRSDPQVRTRIDDVRLDVVRLASLTLDAIRAGTEAFVGGDLDHADRVVADDDAIDSLRHAIEDECLRIIGAPGPVPRRPPLRRAWPSGSPTSWNAAPTSWSTSLAPPGASTPSGSTATAGPLVDRMSRQVIVQLRVAVNAFVDRDPSWAAALADMDDTTDELERRLFRHVLEVDGARRSTTPASTLRCSSRWSRVTTSASATTR